MALHIASKETQVSGERWFDYDEEISFRIAGLDNDHYKVALDRARRLIAKGDSEQSLNNITVTEKDSPEHDIQCQLIGRFIIKDWKGDIQDESGNVISYSPEFAEKLLKSNIDLFVWTISKSAQISSERKEEIEDTVKKQQKDSAGSETGKVRQKSKN